jgi:hypothetical protein
VGRELQRIFNRQGAQRKETGVFPLLSFSLGVLWGFLPSVRVVRYFTLLLTAIKEPVRWAGICKVYEPKVHIAKIRRKRW